MKVADKTTKEFRQATENIILDDDFSNSYTHGDMKISASNSLPTIFAKNSTMDQVLFGSRAFPLRNSPWHK